MFNYIWHTFFFDPVYNGLVFFIDVIPGGDVGLAIIAIVIVVKTILLPLSIKAAKTQRVMREIEPQLKEIKETLKDKREEQAQAMLKIYREAGINPFASIFLIFLQIPILIALYFSVYSGGGIALPAINVDILYNFIAAPTFVNMNFIGLIDITGRNLILALLACVTQYYQIKLAMPDLAPRDPNAPPDFKADFGRNMQFQMRYVMPVIIFFVAYLISAAIALYFVVSNLVAIIQEIYIKKHR
ncbi:MAG TPA: YidC/Oxa1 family membrane protein insertase [Candidatus Paceibacterota bacterium]|nr:YidC/Oxa1 family membrane protein insertase [Candidatus Paceibacterota bacterium]HMO82614.1 YidC/Oxa1 family membrane protein insertase [Candidatus Paceibacterota bacterium]